MADRYSADISCIAHSYGTYVVASYLLGFDAPPIALDTLILTGSILNEELDISRFYGRAAKVINEVAPNDSVVKYAKPVALWQDELLGRSGQVGFKCKLQRLAEAECAIFDHNNVIRRDVVSRRWMPWLEVNIGKGREEAMEISLKTITEQILLKPNR